MSYKRAATTGLAMAGLIGFAAIFLSGLVCACIFKPVIGYSAVACVLAVFVWVRFEIKAADRHHMDMIGREQEGYGEHCEGRR